jgi:hypothetical protein
MNPVKNEIQNGIQRLGLTDLDIRLLPDEEGGRIFNEALSHFVLSGNRRWWWEDFRSSTTNVRFADSQGYARIEKIVPNKKEKIWFIVEDMQLPFYPVYESSPEIIQTLISECYFFEYYLVAKDFRWLICETHHDIVIAIGQEVERKLAQLDNQVKDN